MLPYSLAIALPAQLALLAISLWANSVQSDDPAALFDDPEQRNALIGGGTVTIVLALLMPTILQGALTAFFTDQVLDRGTPVRDCIIVGLKRAPLLIAVAFITAFSMLLGCLAVCIGFFFVMARLGVAAPVCVVERAGPLTSISRSWQLTEKRFWQTLGVVLFNAIAPAIFNSVLTAVVSLPLALINQTASTIGSSAAGWIVSAITTPLATAILVLLYLDLRVRREGLDLQLLGQGLAQPQ